MPFFAAAFPFRFASTAATGWGASRVSAAFALSREDSLEQEGRRRIGRLKNDTTRPHR
jgi:hypothetical protein